MRLKNHYKDRLQAFNLQSNQEHVGVAHDRQCKRRKIGYDNNKNGAYALILGSVADYYC